MCQIYNIVCCIPPAHRNPLGQTAPHLTVPCRIQMEYFITMDTSFTTISWMKLCGCFKTFNALYRLYQHTFHILPAQQRTKHTAGWSLDYFAFSTSVCMYIYLCIRTYHMRTNYLITSLITYIVAMRPYFSWLQHAISTAALCSYYG